MYNSFLSLISAFIFRKFKCEHYSKLNIFFLLHHLCSIKYSFFVCFRITMQEAFTEVDISIINRLSSYMYCPDFKIPKKSPLNVCCLYYPYRFIIYVLMFHYILGFSTSV